MRERGTVFVLTESLSHCFSHIENIQNIFICELNQKRKSVKEAVACKGFKLIPHLVYSRESQSRGYP